MTPRERWLALFNRQPVDRIPTDYTATPEVTARLLAELDCPDQAALWKLLHIDGRIEIEAPWKLPHHPDDPLADMWGVRYQKVDYVWHGGIRGAKPPSARGRMHGGGNPPPPLARPR